MLQRNTRRRTIWALRTEGAAVEKHINVSGKGEALPEDRVGKVGAGASGF